MQGLVYNTKTLNIASGVVVLSYATGKSGSLERKVKPEDATPGNSAA
ncbi:hypothetical protein [uncultured Bacteroides sp.]|nr:hypothetical protein [uncultured Bacteroides sp.]